MQKVILTNIDVNFSYNIMLKSTKDVELTINYTGGNIMSYEMGKYISGVSERYDDRLARLIRDPVIFVHIDTTGLDANRDHISRLSIIADDMLVYCNVFKCDTSRMSNRAVDVSGITREDINASDVTFADEIPVISSMITGKLICCTSKDFMLDFMANEGLALNRDDVIDLKAIVGMMNGTYSRTSMADVLKALLPDTVDKSVPDTTFERNFKMYSAACNLKEQIS